jgi:predicted transcriptional regulator
MAKKVAVIVRDRQHEALRMAVGLTLEDAAVSVYVMDNKLASDENIDLNVETVGDMDGKIYSNNPENKFDQMTTEEIALAIAEADAVIAY